MCGICGIVAFADAFPISRELVERMHEQLAHRGPDGAGELYRGNDRVALGHRRLAIVDLSAAGHQPMSNEDGTVWITYNGEVYNHTALRTELEQRGHRYRSNTDTETIIHLYEEHGPGCVEMLDGMFAFAIWDSVRKELLLARDRLGVKPLYFARLPQGVVFGSEIKALLAHPSLHPELDEAALAEYLTYAFTPPPRTMYRGIEKLGPAERMVISSDGSARTERYWSPFSRSVAERVAAMSEGEACDHARELLRQSISKRMMSDVPFGVFLSGGLDSSTNVALMADVLDRPVRTFSTAPTDYAAYDELPYARLIARRFNTDHHEVLVSRSEMESLLPALAYHLDEPTAEWTSVPQYFVSKLARESGTPVIQVGEGADEVFHGYQGYVDHRRYVVPFQRLPRPVRQAVGSAGVWATTKLGVGVRHGEALYDGAHSSAPYWGGALCFRGPLKQAILNTNGAEDTLAASERLWEEAAELYPAADVFQKMTYVELKQRLPELLLMRLDKVAMAKSVEGRDPFLDHQLVEFAMALPPRMKSRNGVGKYVLREAMRDRLPEEVLRRKKQGFGTPMKEWLREDFGEQIRAQVNHSTLAERGLLDYRRLDQLFDAHRRGRGDWSKHIWNIYSVSVWHDRWIAGR
ncbi:MAG: asparagine synthase (glutamine-hydrolyzing) [Solirubrobacterales bacterium]|nr:asparagine synthase (glutamine-hydrolyzing) [Solirubrobacterales bacterium]